MCVIRVSRVMVWSRLWVCSSGIFLTLPSHVLTVLRPRPAALGQQNSWSSYSGLISLPYEGKKMRASSPEWLGQGHTHELITGQDTGLCWLALGPRHLLHSQAMVESVSHKAHGLYGRGADINVMFGETTEGRMDRYWGDSHCSQ